VSSLNLTAGSTVANLVTVKVGAGGRVRLRNALGSTHLLADLAGYTTGSGAGSSLVAGSPNRILDTRVAGGPLRAGEVRRLQVVGTAGVPAGTTAVVLNVTGAGATARTDVRVYPTRAGAPPLVSNLNPAPGRTTAASVVVPVGADGSISLRNNAGRVDLGRRPAGALHPGRLGVGLRTRRAGPPARHACLRRGARPRGRRDLVVAGAGPVPAPGTAVVLNVTGGGCDRPEHRRARLPHARRRPRPGTSNLNANRGQTVANAVLTTVGRDGRVRLRNALGAVHVVVDLAGWYGPSGEGWDVSWPQCTAAGSTASRLPVGGAFAVVGLTAGGRSRRTSASPRSGRGPRRCRASRGLPQRQRARATGRRRTASAGRRCAAPARRPAPAAGRTASSSPRTPSTACRW
jgi:hypothetical protein